jgi:hypothetical protein
MQLYQASSIKAVALAPRAATLPDIAPSQRGFPKSGNNHPLSFGSSLQLWRAAGLPCHFSPLAMSNENRVSGVNSHG